MKAPLTPFRTGLLSTKSDQQEMSAESWHIKSVLLILSVITFANSCKLPSFHSVNFRFLLAALRFELFGFGRQPSYRRSFPPSFLGVNFICLQSFAQLF
jgi:hypothetical protein